MNLFKFLDKGTAYADEEAARKRSNATEKAREEWINSLIIDQYHLWTELGDKQEAAINGFSVVLTLAGMTKVFDDKGIDSPDIRIIRGALSTAQQAARAGYIITDENAIAFKSAADRAIAILKGCSQDAIAHAAFNMNDIERFMEAA